MELRKQKLKNHLDDYAINLEKVIQAKFYREDYKSVTWSDLISLRFGVWISISEGVDVFLTWMDKEKSKFKILCKMAAGAVLGIHDHPDYFEFFKVLVGRMVCLYNPEIDLHAGDSYTFDMNEIHHPMAPVKTVIEIICSQTRIA